MGGALDDDLWRLRIARQSPRSATPAAASSASPGLLGQVTTASPQVGKFCLVKPVTATGAEAAGGTPTYTVPDDAARVAVYLLGPGAPAQGDYLVARHVDFRWVAERMTGGPPSYPYNCGCPGMTTAPLAYSITYLPTAGTADSATLEGTMPYVPIVDEPRSHQSPNFCSPWTPRPDDFFSSPGLGQPYYRVIDISCAFYLEFANDEEGTGISQLYPMLRPTGDPYPSSTMSECDPFSFAWSNASGAGEAVYTIISGVIHQ